MSRLTTLLARTAVAATLTLAWLPARAALPDGLSGPWYNPAQDGHGLSIFLVDRGQRAAVLWHVYDPAGHPLTLYVDGTVVGREILGTAYAPRGMRFADFDPATLDLPVWGEVRIHFAGCDSATLSWSSSQQGYPDGSLPIVPLAPIEALNCALPASSPLLPGLYQGVAVGARGSSAYWGIVDSEGRLWGSGLYRGALVPQMPSFMVSAEVTLTDLIDDPADGPKLSAIAGHVVHTLTLGSGDIGPAGSHRFTVRSDTGRFDQDWQAGPPAGTALLAPVSLATLQGDYLLPHTPQFAGITGPAFGRIRVDAEGRLCAIYRPELSTACDLEGVLTTPEGDAGLIDFAIADRRSPGSGAFRGRGWLATVDGQRTLTLVGDNGERGFLLIGR